MKRLTGRLLLVLLALLLAPTQAWADKLVALSFDDVPRDRGAFLTPDERTVRLVAALKRARVRQAVFFVTPGLLEQPDGAGGEARISAYARAGHVLANHSWDHTALSALDAPAYLADLDRTAAWLHGRPSYRPWFRFPYLDEGQTDLAKYRAVQAGLRTRGLHDGYVTIDGSDWVLEELSVTARTQGRVIDMHALRDLYLFDHVNAAEAADAMARKILGRSPVHVMLLHETDLAALYIADLVTELHRHGWRVVPIDRAYRDPVARLTPHPGDAEGTLLDMLADERRVDDPLWPQPLSDDTLRFLFDKQVIRANAKPAGTP